jgi:hypothetical protein
MWTIKTTDGIEIRVSAGMLQRLRMFADWQVKASGYDPQSVTLACRKQDDLRERAANVSSPQPEDDQ